MSKKPNLTPMRYVLVYETLCGCKREEDVTQEHYARVRSRHQERVPIRHAANVRFNPGEGIRETRRGYGERVFILIRIEEHQSATWVFLRESES